MKKATITLTLLFIVLFLLGCQLSEKVAELTTTKTSAEAESSEEAEIVQELEEFDELNGILAEDFDFQELETLPLE